MADVNRQAIGDVWKYAPLIQNNPQSPMGQPMYAPMGNYEMFLRDLMSGGPGAVYNTMFPQQPQQMLGAPMMPPGPPAPPMMPQQGIPSYSGYGDPIMRIREIEKATR